jgi:3-hydroxyethyl bacteriochlorophyllide a dehydrogenase
MGKKGYAFVFPKPNKAEIREYDVPELEDKEILVEIEYAGVSTGTERQIFYGQDDRAVFPVITGYQSVGIVSETKGDCRGIKAGDRVLAGPGAKVPGLNICWGSHVSHAVLNAESVVPCPSGVTPEAGAMAWLAAIGNQGNTKAGVKEGDIVTVVGQGMIGQMAAQVAKVKGAKKVITADTKPFRLELSKKHTADVVVDASKEDIKEVLFAESKEGADVAFEATGIKELVPLCLDLLKPGGTLVYQGWYAGDMVFPFQVPHEKQAKMVFPFAWAGTEAIALVAGWMAEGKMNVEPLITHNISYKEAPKLYPELVSKKAEDVMGIIINFKA